jgi:Rad3-related DNA helicase
MWSLYEGNNELKPLTFSNGKTQKDIVNEVITAANNGYKIIFIKGSCGSGKSAIALNLARHFGKASIVVPIKSLQEQYTQDYTQNKFLLKNNKKLKITSIFGRKNFKCLFLEKTKPIINNSKREKNSNLFESLEQKYISRDDSSSCDNTYIPCKIEIKEKNSQILKDYIKNNPSISIKDFNTTKNITRMSIAPVCPFWSPIYPESLELKKFDKFDKLKYLGLNGISFVIYKREFGCPYYQQYESYADADVLIFNSSKYKIETEMNRRPLTEIDIIDECDEFLDSFSNEEQISLNKLLFSLNALIVNNSEDEIVQKDLIYIANSIKFKDLYKNAKFGEFYDVKGSLVETLLETILKHNHLIDSSNEENIDYLSHLFEIALIFKNFFNESFFSVEKKENDLIIKIVTTNLQKRFEELVNKNKLMVLMSGTIHSEKVLKNIFGLSKFKIIEAETKQQGELIVCKNGYEKDCKYENFKSNKITREDYLKALTKSIESAKKPVLVHVNSFSDLPTESEKLNLGLLNLPTQNELLSEQISDPLGKKIKSFKNKEMDVLFTTKCNRGIDFPGEICNSIIITRFPYPNISSLFWKILRKTKPEYFRDFYLDKSSSELLQKIYRGLRSKTDKVYLLSPDIRVLNFDYSSLE